MEYMHIVFTLEHDLQSQIGVLLYKMDANYFVINNRINISTPIYKMDFMIHLINSITRHFNTKIVSIEIQRYSNSKLNIRMSKSDKMYIVGKLDSKF